MMQSIFTRPLFINPQAYLVIPELVLIDKCDEFAFDEVSSYTFQVITSGEISGKLISNDDQFILHLDLYTPDGNVILGEFNITGSNINPDQFQLSQSNGMVTITFNNIQS